MASIVVTASWELLQSTNVTDAELARLQKGWERLEFISAVKGGFVMERASVEVTIQKMRASNVEFQRVIGAYSSMGPSVAGGTTSSGDWLEDIKNSARESFQKTKFAGATVMWRTSWTYSDELNALKNDQDILEAIRLIETNQCFQPAYSNLMERLYPAGMSRLYSSGGAAKIYDDVLYGLDDMRLRQLFSGSVDSLTATVRKTMAAEASKRIVIAAIALKRFQLIHGKFPERLSELAPEFVASIPLDPVDGKPLRYHRNADDTFLLYSVGEDNIDNGGDPNSTSASSSRYFPWQGNKVRDWVWPQPATAVEVKNYYDEQAAEAAAGSDSTLLGLPPGAMPPPPIPTGTN